MLWEHALAECSKGCCMAGDDDDDGDDDGSERWRKIADDMARLVMLA